MFEPDDAWLTADINGMSRQKEHSPHPISCSSISLKAKATIQNRLFLFKCASGSSLGSYYCVDYDPHCLCFSRRQGPLKSGCQTYPDVTQGWNQPRVRSVVETTQATNPTTEAHRIAGVPRVSRALTRVAFRVWRWLSLDTTQGNPSHRVIPSLPQGNLFRILRFLPWAFLLDKRWADRPQSVLSALTLHHADRPLPKVGVPGRWIDLNRESFYSASNVDNLSFS